MFKSSESGNSVETRLPAHPSLRQEITGSDSLAFPQWQTVNDVLSQPPSPREEMQNGTCCVLFRTITVGGPATKIQALGHIVQMDRE